MKNYYFDPKSQDLYIFDPSSKDMLVLERIEGIRVLTSSEIDRPVDDDGNRTRPNGIGRAGRPIGGGQASIVRADSSIVQSLREAGASRLPREAGIAFRFD